MVKNINKNYWADWIARFGLDLGVDLGSSNMLICLKKRGVVVNEASMVTRLRNKRWMGLTAPKAKGTVVVAFGNKAKEMRSKSPIQMEVVSPIKYGIINDLELAEKLVANFLKYAYEIPSKIPKFLKPRMVVSVPCSITEVQRRAVKSVFKAVGVREVILVENAVLAALGTGLPLDSNVGLLVVDIGGGKTEAAVVSLGGVVVVKSSKLSSSDLDEEIINFIKMKYGLLIGENTAERIKIELGDVWGEENNKSAIARGRDLETGLPRSVKLTQGEVREALVLLASKIVKIIKETLDETPPELMEDILKRGIVLVGQGAKLRGLDKLIESGTKITTRIAEEPEMAVIRGCQKLIEDRSWLHKIKSVTVV